MGKRVKNQLREKINAPKVENNLPEFISEDEFKLIIGNTKKIINIEKMLRRHFDFIQ